MTTTMSEHTATLLDAFCQSWMRDREAEAREVSTIVSWRAQEAGRTKHRK